MTRTEAPPEDNQRKSFINSLNMAANLLSQPKKEMQCKVVIVSMEHISKAHDKEMSGLRSPEATLAYNIAYASGKHWSVFSRMFASMQDINQVAFVGFLSGHRLAGAAQPPHGAASSSSSRSAKASSLSAQAGFENEVAADWWHLVCALVRQRLMSTSHWSHSYPGLFAPLLSESPEVVVATVKRAEEAWAALTEAESKRHDSMAIQTLLKVALETTALMAGLSKLPELPFVFHLGSLGGYS